MTNFMNSLFCSKVSVPSIHTSALSRQRKARRQAWKTKEARNETRDRSSPSCKSLSHKMGSSEIKQINRGCAVTQMKVVDRERDREADMYPGQRQELSGVSVSVSRLPALSRPHHTKLHAPLLQHLSRST